jgi:hypothetical protein
VTDVGSLLYVYIHICIYIYILIYRSVYMYSYIYVYIYTYSYSYIYVYIYTYIYLGISTFNTGDENNVTDVGSLFGFNDQKKEKLRQWSKHKQTVRLLRYGPLIPYYH